jgi:hypothetical protein
MSAGPSAKRVLDAAISVATAAPEQKGASVFAAQIPWTRITELREALDALGIEWRDK